MLSPDRSYVVVRVEDAYCIKDISKFFPFYIE